MTANSTSNAAICSLRMRRCLIRNNWASTDGCGTQYSHSNVIHKYVAVTKKLAHVNMMMFNDSVMWDMRVWLAGNPAGLAGDTAPPLIEHAQMRQPDTPASRACAICGPRGEAKHTGRWHFRTGRQPAGRRALTAEAHCSSSWRVRHLVFLSWSMADSDSPPTSGTPRTSTDTPTNTAGSRPTAMSEEAVRALISQEVSAAVAAALHPHWRDLCPVVSCACYVCVW